MVLAEGLPPGPVPLHDSEDGPPGQDPRRNEPVPGARRPGSADLLTLAPRVFLEGDPGAGKSTLLRWIACQQAARGLAAPVPLWIRLSDLRARAEDFLDHCAELALASVHLPVACPARAALREALQSREPESGASLKTPRTRCAWPSFECSRARPPARTRRLSPRSSP